MSLIRHHARLAIALAAMVALILPGLLSGLVSIDHYGGVYGMSIGTNNSYCSLEIFPFSFTCETAR